MPISYPDIAPTTLEFIPAKYDTITPLFRDIVTSPRLPKSIPSGPVLKLGYENITASNVLAILNAWDQSYSGVFPITLPAALVSGTVSTDFAGRITTPKTTDWRFKERPRVDRFVVGVASVSVILVGEFYRHGFTPPPRTEPEDFDPLFPNVSFLLQPEQAAGSTALVDISNNPKTIYNPGNVVYPGIVLNAATVVDSPDKAVRFDGSTTILRVDNGNWADFTGVQACVEFIFRMTDTKVTSLAYKGSVFGNLENWHFKVWGAGINIGYAPGQWMYSGPGTVVAANVRHHLAVTNDPIANRLTLWFNGVALNSTPNLFTYSGASAHVSIGGDTWYQPYLPSTFNGDLIAMRVTKNSLRYTAPFTPPSRFFTSA